MHRSTLLPILTLLLLAVPGPLPGISYRQTELADGFDYPVGKPDAFGYYRYRGFRPNYHMGEDWNGLGGGNSDLGKPVYSIANGIVVYSENYGSNWGNVMIIRHAYRSDGRIQYIDSLYGHLRERYFKKYDRVKRGQKVGTIGNNRGMYAAHLHFEIRKNINVGLVHRRYARDYSNYYRPSDFIDRHRSLPLTFQSHPVPVDSFHSGVKSRYYGSRLDSIPDNPIDKPKPPPRLPPEVQAVLKRNGLLASEGSEAPDEVSPEEQEQEEQRLKIRTFWSTTRHKVQTMMGPEDTVEPD